MADFLTVSVSGNLDVALDKFATEIQEKVARAGAQQMAQVVYEAAKQNAPVGDTDRVKKASGRVIRPGALRDSIYQVFSQDNSNSSLKTYHVGWNRKKAPHGHLIEFGTSRMAARPFLYPAYEQNQGRLIDAANAKMAEVLKGIT